MPTLEGRWSSVRRRMGIGARDDSPQQLGLHDDLVDSFRGEVHRGERFEFGRNWRRYLSVLTDARIAVAERSIQELLGCTRLEGRSFLDVGSGSGLFSLAARRLGARVHSFDYDPQSVACAAELKRRYFADDTSWTIEHGSVLDRAYMTRIGTFDIAYSWGVLHHTGKMWQALDAVLASVRAGGRLAVALYNDQGLRSRQWRHIKRLYCAGTLGRLAVTSTFIPVFACQGAVYDLIAGRNPMDRYRESTVARGMSPVHDWLDWLGGYPFETSTPAEVFNFCHRRGFALDNLRTTSSGCNEYVFTRTREV